MNSVSSQVGIDVHRDFLEVSIDGKKSFQTLNQEEPIRKLAERLEPGAEIHVEASGGYDRMARRILRAAGFTVRTHDPLRVRRMAQARASRGKTDALDAARLAIDGPSLPANPVKSAEREALCDLSRAIQDLKGHARSLKVRAGAPGFDETAKAAVLRACACVEEEADRLEAEFVVRVRASSLGERYELARSVPGVGPCLARVAVCELPEQLDDYTKGQLCSYAGVAPLDRQSGTKKGPARIGRGNSRLKAALYMPALSCTLAQAWAKELYAKLRAAGRAHQQAVVALMRRLLIRILVVLKRGSPWLPEPLKT